MKPTRQLHFTLLQAISLRSILILSTKLHLDFPSSLFHSGFPMETLFALNIIHLTRMFTLFSPESHVNNKHTFLKCILCP